MAYGYEQPWRSLFGAGWAKVPLSSNFDQIVLFFFKLSPFSSSFWPSGWVTHPPGKTMATPLLQHFLQFALAGQFARPISRIFSIFSTCSLMSSMFLLPHQEPATPEGNKFKTGMKLEAVDHKNPYLICPATVGEVKENMFFVQFDGWKGATDYWCEYDSRDIFPVGWCAATLHPLQHPGKRGRVTYST